MSTKEFDYLVFIGRFQPFHNGHKKVVDRALELSKKVIILVGSSNTARSYRNPWTFEERKQMISCVYDPFESWEDMIENQHMIDDNDDVPGNSRLIIRPINDSSYNDQQWIKQVQKIVNDIVLKDINSENPSVYILGLNDVKIGLIGHSKDQTSYYLKLFPNWGSVDVPQHVVFNATDIRKQYFTSTPRIPSSILPTDVIEYLHKFLETDSFKQIYDEYQYIENYKLAWKNAPYDPVFVTTDAIVIQSGHVLIVRRRASPGKGLMALPGGFLETNEKIEDSMIRELREETRLKVPDPVLRGNIKKIKVFDDPNRSSRGRTITHAYLIELPPSKDLPKVKGGSDATRAEWIPLAALKADEMFEDHYHIVQNMTGDL